MVRLNEEKYERNAKNQIYTGLMMLKTILGTVAVLALPAPWARFLRRPLTAIQTHTKKYKGYNEIIIY